MNLIFYNATLRYMKGAMFYIFQPTVITICDLLPDKVAVGVVTGGSRV